MILHALLFMMTTRAVATPRQQAVRIVSVGLKKPATVLRSNAVGRYETVLTSGGVMEGWNVTAPILFERFSFGWQPLDVLNFGCRLDSHSLPRGTAEALMRGMPKPKNDAPCEHFKDTGPPEEVEAVRSMMRGPLVPYVIVSGDWAMGEWYGGGGGQSLYARRGGRWRLIASGGGEMAVEDMAKYGVPRSDWCKFGVYGAKCR